MKKTYTEKPGKTPIPRACLMNGKPKIPYEQLKKEQKFK